MVFIKTQIVELIRRIGHYLHQSSFDWKQKLEERAVERSCSFIEKNSSSATNFFENQWDLRADCFKKKPSEGLILEFGVSYGRSASFFCEQLSINNDSRRIFGFDTFTGLTEDWSGTDMFKGTFNRQGVPPKLNPRIKLIKGDILETLLPFLNKNSGQISFVHIDTDTYTPCLHILKNIKPRLIKGSVILFDELVGYPSFEHHELKALNEVLERSSYEFISFGVSKRKSRFIKAAIQIL